MSAADRIEISPARMAHLSKSAIPIIFATALFVATSVVAEDRQLGSHPWVSTEWEILCPEPIDSSVDSCEDHDAAAQVFEEYLEGASIWFKDLGFRGPNIRAPFGKYQAQIVRDEDAFTEAGKPYSGMYDDQQKLIYLKESDFFAMGDEGETFDSGSFRVQTSFMMTAVHELFHAIQQSYSHQVCGEGRGWMCEGMADAALRAYHNSFESEMNIAMSVRQYDVPLHEPGNEDWGYGTWDFWLEVGQHLNSPGHIKYLQDVLTGGMGTKFGLHALDYGLEPYGKLYEVLPWFFAQQNSDGQFGPPLRRDVRLEARRQEVEKRVSDIVVKAVAGRAVKLRILRDTDKAVGVKVSFAQPNDDLHLIVNGTRYDKMLGDRRNAFFTVHDDDGPLALDVVIANVGKSATFSREEKVDLVIAVSGQYASMGEAAAGSASLAAEINTPLSIELDEYQAVVRPGSYVKTGDRYLGKGMSDGIFNPCMLRISGSAERRPGASFGDQMVLALQTSGPIVPETYAIVWPSPDSSIEERFPVGKSVVSLLIADTSGNSKEYQFSSGQLRIDSVAGGMIRGHLSGTGVNREYSSRTQRYEPVAALNLAVKFSILNSRSGVYSNKPFACLE